MFQRIKIREVKNKNIFAYDTGITQVTYACDECGDLYTIRAQEFGRRLLSRTDLSSPQLCDSYAAMCHRTLQYPFYTDQHLTLACMGIRCEFCRKEEASRARGPYNPYDWICSDCAGDD